MESIILLKRLNNVLIIVLISLTIFSIMGCVIASENISSDDLGGALQSSENIGNIFNNSNFDSEKIFNEAYSPKLMGLSYYQKSNGDYYAKLSWFSKKDSTYQVLRKTNDDFEVIATVKGDSMNSTFYDKIDGETLYTYSVREIKSINGKNITGPYDEEGLKLINKTDVTVDFQNLKSEVKWKKLDDASGYLVFRKIGRDGKYECIAEVDANQTSYTDYYSNSSAKLSKLLNGDTFIDPSYNELFYTVQGFNKTNEISRSYGLYSLDGDFHLEAPSIVSLKDSRITWGKVPNADGYIIFKRDSPDGKWEKIGKVKDNGTNKQSMKLEIDKNAFYTVQAYAEKNGKFSYSKFDEGFSLRNFNKSNSEYKILYFGDSITYGSPYKSPSNRHVFSIPYRVSQLTGCTYYNPSIPGSTYHDLGEICGINVLKGFFYRYRICREVVDPISVGELPANWKDLDTSKNSLGKTNTKIEDYNIVVLAAGTNDYYDDAELGPIDSNDTKSFNGALNHILGKIEESSKKRVERGEDPIKVVFVDLYYSDRCYEPQERQNRDITPNRIGLTLVDYQKALDAQYERWDNKSEYLTFYNFKTRDYGIVDEENCPYASSDNLHFTKFTYGQYGNAFAEFLVMNVF